VTETEMAAISRSLSESLQEAEGTLGTDNFDVKTTTGDLIAGVRDYLDETAADQLDRRAISEVAYAWLAGGSYVGFILSHEKSAAYAALRKAGLSQ
jgi:hypothetical protein